MNDTYVPTCETPACDHDTDDYTVDDWWIVLEPHQIKPRRFCSWWHADMFQRVGAR